jgi:hypothetical protein
MLAAAQQITDMIVEAIREKEKAGDRTFKIAEAVNGGAAVASSIGGEIAP